MTFSIHTMQPHELSLALEWAANEGWNPGLHDASSFYAADPQGFFIAKLNDEPIGCISAVKYGEDYGFLGLYIVKPEYRGKGYGMALWNAAMAYLGNRTIGLDGVVEQQENYKKSGFTLLHRNIRFEGIAIELDVLHPIFLLSSLPFESLLAYDAELFGAPRSAFLRAWISQPHSLAYGVASGDRLHGYGVIRKCRQGYKIGPLFADTPDIADSLLAALTKPFADETFTLDIAEVNNAALALVEKHTMKHVFETARMYTSPPPSLPLERIFGITSFELG